ncbi:MAG: transcriptional repressor LexA [Eubacteriales bacterium]|nr:transcriptional repressor LexA [Eubacteriales bacterium]
MRHKDTSVLYAIERFIREYTNSNGYSPTMQEIASETGVSRPTVQRYVAKLCEDGILNRSGYRSVVASKDSMSTVSVPVLGRIACGIPKFAEENIEEYVRLPVSLFGKGEFFILRADGDSMIEAGIDDGDLVLIRQQSAADEGQIVVALVDNTATLKRFYPEPENKRIRLHPENKAMKDIYVKSCEIQGVAVKVFKDL